MIAPYRIAIVDDDPDLQVFLQELFKAEGHSVSSFSSGKDFTEAFYRLVRSERSQKPWDLVVSDLCLPGQNGLELIEFIHSHDPTLPTILITAHGSIDIAIQALNSGVFDLQTYQSCRNERACFAGR